MAFLKQSNPLTIGLNKIKEYVYIRSDNEDYIRHLCNDDKFGSRLKYILSNTVMANSKLERRIKESTLQDMAALTWDAFGQRHTGKSWFNFLLAVKILTNRGVKNPIETIIFKDSKGSIINSPSRWNDGIKNVAGSMENKNDGYRFALLQDEMDPEWGEGRMKQSKNQNSAVDNLRKLKVLVGFAHVKKEDVKFNLDMRFLMLGYNRKTRKMAAVLYFTRPVGIVHYTIPEELAKYLTKEYNEDAVSAVWDKAKKGFHQSATDPDSDNSVEEQISNELDGVFNGDRFLILQSAMLKYWKDKMKKRSPALSLSAYLIWKHKQDGITSSNARFNKINWVSIATDWWKENGDTATNQMFYTSNNKYFKEGKEYYHLIKQGEKILRKEFHTNEQKKVGESYAYNAILDHLKNLDEHLISSFKPELQYGDSTYLHDGGLPYDVVLLGVTTSESEMVDIVAINHKLHIFSDKRYGLKQLDDKFGISPHPVSLLWVTYARPFREKFYIKFNPDNKFIIDLEKLLESNEVLKKWGLGTQWKEIDWKQLTEILQILLKK